MERVISPALPLPKPLFVAFAARGELASQDARMTLRLIVGGFPGVLPLRPSADAGG